MSKITNDRLARLVEWQESVLTEAGRDEFLQRCARVLHLDEVCRELDLPRDRVLAFLAGHADLNAAARAAMEWYAHHLVAEAKTIADGAPTVVKDPETGEPLIDSLGNVVTAWPDVRWAKLQVDTNFRLAGVYKPSRYGEASRGEVVVPRTPDNVSLLEVARRLAFTLARGARAMEPSPREPRLLEAQGVVVKEDEE